jgi:GTP cyclohydrolase III
MRKYNVCKTFKVKFCLPSGNTPDDAEDSDSSPVKKKTKEDRKLKEATSVKNELKKKTLAGM